MRRIFKVIAAVALMQLPIDVVVAAQTVSAASSTDVQVGQSVAIPFNPPLDVPLMYRHTIDETRSGRPVSTRLNMRVVFTRDADGYVMTATYLLPPGASPTHPAMAVLTRPLPLRIGSDGQIVGIVDEAGYWAALDSIMGGLAQHLGADAEAAAAMRGMLTSMRNMPEESRIALVARNVSPIVEFAGTHQRLDAITEGTVTGESPFGPITQEIRTSLVGVSNSTARLESVYRIQPDQFDAIVSNVEARFGANAQARAAAIAEVMIERRDTYRVSLGTGLTELHESVITAAGEIDGSTGQARRRQRLEIVR